MKNFEDERKQKITRERTIISNRFTRNSVSKQEDINGKKIYLSCIFYMDGTAALYLDPVNFREMDEARVDKFKINLSYEKVEGDDLISESSTMVISDPSKYTTLKRIMYKDKSVLLKFKVPKGINFAGNNEKNVLKYNFEILIYLSFYKNDKRRRHFDPSNIILSLESSSES